MKLLVMPWQAMWVGMDMCWGERIACFENALEFEIESQRNK